jgi:dTDP-4-amino-4,6-dideoxygalactose transaminase
MSGAGGARSGGEAAGAARGDVPSVAQSGVPAATERIGLGVALRRQHAALLPDFRCALDEVAASGAFVLGPQVAALEAALAARTGAGAAVAVHSGTDALYLALRVLDVGPGDEVILPAFTFFATAEAVMWLGATPVLADVDARTLLIDVERAAACITSRTRAIVPVHLYGQCAPVEALAAAARERGARSAEDGGARDTRRGRRARPIAIVEDMAQALDATRGGRPAGSLGDFAALSFYVTKNIGALGDGGMVLARRREDAARLRALRDHGSTRKYLHEEAGLNSRLDTLQAAFLLAKLAHLDAWTARRRALAARFDAALAGLPLVLPATDGANTHVFHLYTVRTPHRDALREHLLARGIEAGVHYPLGLHRQPALAAHVPDPSAFPVAERVASEVLSLPLFPEMTDGEADRVVDAVRSFPAFA